MPFPRPRPLMGQPEPPTEAADKVTVFFVKNIHFVNVNITLFFILKANKPLRRQVSIWYWTFQTVRWQGTQSANKWKGLWHLSLAPPEPQSCHETARIFQGRGARASPGVTADWEGSFQVQVITHCFASSRCCHCSVTIFRLLGGEVFPSPTVPAGLCSSLGIYLNPHSLHSLTAVCVYFFLSKTGLNLKVQWTLTQIKFQNFVRVVGDTPGSRQSTYHLVTTKISMEKVVLEFTQTCASLTELTPG